MGAGRPGRHGGDTNVDDRRRHARRTAPGCTALPGEGNYDEARAVWNGRFDAHPAAVARCAGTAGVAAVTFARERDLPISVKGGGHDYVGHAVHDDRLLIDLSPVDAVRVDPDARTARVGARATWDDGVSPPRYGVLGPRARGVDRLRPGDADRIDEVYGGNDDRLTEVKAAGDPADVFGPTGTWCRTAAWRALRTANERSPHHGLQPTVEEVGDAPPLSDLFVRGLQVMLHSG